MPLSTPDLIVLVVGGLFAVRGAFKGFAWQAVRTSALVGAIVVANLFYERLAGWLDDHLSFLPFEHIVAWIVIALGVYLVLGVFAYMARGLVRSARLTSLDRALGLLMGAAMGFVLCTLGFSVYASFQTQDETRATFQGSHAVLYMARAVRAAKPLAPEPIREKWIHVLGAIEDAVPPE
jgi:uncharacterized membrane protein required for colicin V production